MGGGVTTNFGGVDVVPLITQKLVFAIWGLCWYNLFFLFFCFKVQEKEVFKIFSTACYVPLSHQ